MNKGLFAHLAVSGLYIMAALFVVGGEETTMDQRGTICVVFLLPHLFVAAIADTQGWYKQKL